MKTININPITRVEGHGKLTLKLDDSGHVTDALFCVQEFRGFEKFLEGALAENLPMLTARICGICPVSHHLASVKAIEACFGTQIPPAAVKLREMLLLSQVLESHILSLAVLSLPDLVLPDSAPQQRNIAGLYETNQEAVQRALTLRGIGTAVGQTVGRRAGMPIGARVGGMVMPLREEERQALLTKLSAAGPHLVWFAKFFRDLVEKNGEVFETLGDIQTAYMGLVRDQRPAFYDGEVQVIRPDASVAARFHGSQYFDYIEEKLENWSYMKFPVLKSGERFRVGPLARVNLVQEMPTPLASRELAWFRQRWGRPAHKTLGYHYARLIEAIYAMEHIRELLLDPEITSDVVCIKPEIKAGVGVGVVEAPRGLLVHRYELDAAAKAVKVDLVVATQHNNYGFNDALKETAGKLIHNGDPDPATLNRLEMIVRAYDPCLSCATHALDAPGFRIELVSPEGRIVREWGA
ncbi:MAG: Ni/Fe hydrogenase subunit alpha [Anaerolineae bacterium]